MGTVLGALFFGLAAYIGVLLAGTVKVDEPLDGSPVPAEPPVPWIVCGFAVIGALLAMHSVTSAQIVLFAIVTCALAAIWCTDVRYGIVPDVFTLGPLGLIFLVALLQQQPWPFLWAAIPFIPFAITALISKGRGMGWGDVKLAALGGAVLGAETALLAFCAGCLIAVVYTLVCGKRGTAIAFAPYMAGAIAVALPFVNFGARW
jgi:prepilin signal peptidase PulO-like enzyme (type II secretory pathway)